MELIFSIIKWIAISYLGLAVVLSLIFAIRIKRLREWNGGKILYFYALTPYLCVKEAIYILLESFGKRKKDEWID